MSLPPSPPLKPLVRRSILHIPTPPGSNLSAREPTVSCADSSPKIVPFTITQMSRFSSLLTKSMSLPESVLATVLQRNCLSSNWIESTLPTDSVLYSNQVFNLLLQFSTKKIFLLRIQIRQLASSLCLPKFKVKSPNHIRLKYGWGISMK